MVVALAEQLWETEARALAALAGHPLLARQDHLALAEAAGSPWFDALGNALALEALSHPLLAARHAPLCTGIEAFLDALAEGGALRRRAGPRGLVIRSDDPHRLHIETPGHVFTGDLRRGELVQALRTDPGRPVARHTGNMVSFRLGGREHSVDVEDSIADCGVLREAGGVRVFHESRIAGRGRFRWRDRGVGTLRYEYAIRADTPVLGLRVTFTPAPGAAPENLVLSTALDAMSAGGALRFRRATLDAVSSDAFPPDAAPVLPGPARTVSFHQDGAPARALAIHLRPGDPATLQSLTVTGDPSGHAHWALLRHAGCSVAEERLVLAGAPRADVEAIFARLTPERGRDVSLCPAPAMVAHSLAMRHLWRLRAGGTPGTQAPIGRARGWASPRLPATMDSPLPPGVISDACLAGTTTDACLAGTTTDARLAGTTTAARRAGTTTAARRAGTTTDARLCATASDARLPGTISEARLPGATSTARGHGAVPVSGGGSGGGGELRRLLDTLHDAGDDPAFLTLAEDAVLRAGLRARHAPALDRLLASGDAGPAALLALARATTLGAADARLATAIARILAALDAAPAEDGFDRAVLLRALRAVQAAQVLGALVLAPAACDALARLAVREAPIAGPADAPAALRAARLLARLAPDALVMRIAPAGAAA